MFTKASEQLYLSFIFKMPRTRIQQDRHNEKRRQAQSKARQAVFSMEYIQIKHPEIYNEACEFFTLINSRYPDKHDLRKTNEFLCFKQMSGGKVCKNGKATLYFDTRTATVVTSHSESPPVETSHSESPPVETSHCESPSVETSHCESPPMETSHSESPQTTETTASGCKELEPLLEIPLISTQQGRKATVTTQTVQITTEQEIPPISFNDIESDAIDQIIEQLRQDPDLTNIFNDIEQQMEFDKLGEDLDIPELNLLEQELWW